MQSGLKWVLKHRRIPSGIRDGVTWKFPFYPILSRQITRHRYATMLPDSQHLCLPVFSPSDGSIERRSPAHVCKSHDNILSLGCVALSWQSELERASPFVFSEPASVIQPTDVWGYLGKARLFISRYSLSPFCTSSSRLLHFRRFSSSTGSGHKDITYKENGEQRKHQYSVHVRDKAGEIIGLPTDVTDRI